MRRWALALAALGVLPAPAGAAPPAAAGGAAVVSKTPPAPRGGRSGLEARVARLTRALGLDPEQQAALRKVLQEQRRRVQLIWSGGPASAADRIAATRRVSADASDRIRAILSEEQLKKYDPPRQGDPGKAIGSAQVEDWMNGGKRN